MTCEFKPTSQLVRCTLFVAAALTAVLVVGAIESLSTRYGGPAQVVVSPPVAVASTAR